MFYISSLMAENFNGSFQGNTKTSTIIEALDGSVDCSAMINAGLTPSVIKFAGGEPRVRFMTINADQTCIDSNRMTHILHFTGASATDDSCSSDVIFGSVDRMILDGTSRLNGPIVAVSAEAEGNDLGGCKDILLGTLKVNRSEIRNTEIGIITTMKSGAQVDINFNEFLSNFVAVFLVDTNQNTTITTNTFTADNAVDGSYFGAVVFTGSADAPTSTRAVIHNNSFVLQSTFTSNETSIAISTQQPGRIANISGVITNNTFDLDGAGTLGIFSLDTSNTHVSANRFAGSGQAAVRVDGDTPVSGITITANRGLESFDSVSGFDIVLQSNTTGCIVGPGQNATVIDNGTGNDLLGIGYPSPASYQAKPESGASPHLEVDESNSRYSQQLQDLSGRLHLQH
jgi:hypothetical protein